MHDTGDREYLQTVVDNDIQIKATFEKSQSENQEYEFDFSLTCGIEPHFFGKQLSSQLYKVLKLLMMMVAMMTCGGEGGCC